MKWLAENQIKLKSEILTPDTIHTLQHKAELLFPCYQVLQIGAPKYRKIS